MEAHPGNRGVIFRRVFPSLNRSVVPMALRSLHRRATYNQVAHSFRFPNGSVLELGHLQYEHTVHDYKSAEYGVIAFEEVTEFLEAQVEFMLSRLRAPVDGVRPHMICTTNPGGVGHAWVKRRWVKPRVEDLGPAQEIPLPTSVWRPRATPDRPSPLRRCFVPATLADNPALTRRDPGYRQRIQAISNRGLRRALEHGDWDAIDAVEGALWRSHELELGRVWDAPLAQRRVVAVDPSDGTQASDQYGVCVAQLGQDGHVYVEASFGWRMSPQKLADATVELARDVRADALVVERNHGGRWLETVLCAADRQANVRTVWASEGKRARAEPIAALFEPTQDWPASRAHLVGLHEELEGELTTFTGKPGEPSPDRLDAMVWAIHELAFEPSAPEMVTYYEPVGISPY